MKKYIQITKSHIINSLEFRGEVFGFVLTWVISTISSIVLFLAVYKDGNQLGDYELSEIILYYLAILLISFITESYIGQELANQIRKGELSKYLLKPYSLFGEKLGQALGSKAAYFIFPIPAYIIFLVVLFNLILPDINFIIPESQYLFIAFIFSWLGFVLNYILEYLAAGFAYFIDETWSISHFKYIILTIIGGANFPLDIAKGNFAKIITILPFKFVYYIPVSYLTGKRSINSYLVEDLILIFFWIIFIYILTKFLWKSGLKKYGAYGN